MVLRRGVCLALTAIALAGCTTSLGPIFGPSTPSAPAEPPPAPELPATIRSEELIGSWGLAAYHRPEDRTRIEASARAQCGQPYVITMGPTGGVVMHLADQAQPEELRLKGSPSGKNFIGPPGPAGQPADREVISFDGRVLITRYVDPDAGNRYGNMVYVRCGATTTTAIAPKKKKK